MFLEISWNSQQNTFARVSFLIKLQQASNFIEKRLWHRCFPVNFMKFLRTPFLQNTSGRLLLFVQNVYYLKNIWSANIIKPNVDWRYSFYILLDRTQNTSSMSILTPRRKHSFNSSYQSSSSNFRESFQWAKVKVVFDIPNLQGNWLSFADSRKRFEATEFVKIWSWALHSRLTAFQYAKYEIIHLLSTQRYAHLCVCIKVVNYVNFSENFQYILNEWFLYVLTSQCNSITNYYITKLRFFLIKDGGTS